MISLEDRIGTMVFSSTGSYIVGASERINAEFQKRCQNKIEADLRDSVELTCVKPITNEVAWEHYMAMRGASSVTLKNGNYDVEDVRKSIKSSYETRYNEMVKEHGKGDRQVNYELTGKRSLTLDEDLEGLEEAYKMRLANLKGYLTCRQTNRAFANPDSSWYFRMR